MRALGKVAPEQAIPMLLEMLNEADPQVRVRAAHLLSEMGPTARQAVPSLLPAVRVRSKEERVQNSSDYRCELSVHVLTGIGPEAKAAVPRLIEVVEKEPNIVPRCRAAIALI